MRRVQRRRVQSRVSQSRVSQRWVSQRWVSALSSHYGATASLDAAGPCLLRAPMRANADVVVIRQIGQDQPPEFDRVDGSLMLKGHSSVRADENGVGHARIPLRIEGGHKVVRLRGAE